MNNTFKNSGDISGANINIGGNNVHQSIQTTTSASEEDLKPLLKLLAEKVSKIEDAGDRQFAESKLNSIEEQMKKPAKERDKTILQRAFGVIENIVEAAKEVHEIKNKLLGM
ncbi:hypothetical protein [Candidatus Albibeggiatoa sp. nov. NOAA]|uniref:hypothetical protein n=1 Tax=Candidatus Albibeggiatoa sp. nov. NOAA TaxID=3162724 RepID=UPI0032FA27E4|nr:hypothetical protein [Thiotrichaceae bacterium]